MFKLAARAGQSAKSAVRLADISKPAGGVSPCLVFRSRLRKWLVPDY